MKQQLQGILLSRRLKLFVLMMQPSGVYVKRDLKSVAQLKEALPACLQYPRQILPLE
jgi:hypothetical protein